MVNFKINDRELSAPKGTTILDAAQKAGIPIPHLCFLKEINEIAACRMCVVEIEGVDRLVPACNTESAADPVPAQLQLYHLRPQRLLRAAKALP